MKKSIYLSIYLSILFVNLNYAQIQTWKCVEMVNSNSYSSTANAEQPQTPSSALNDDPDAAAYPDSFPGVKHTFKVVFSIVTDLNGNRTDFVGEDIVMNVIRDLNVTYQNANIYFKYGGFEYINGTGLSGDIQAINLSTIFFNYLNDHSVYHIIILNGNILSYDENSNLISIPGFGGFYGPVAYFSFQGITSKRVPAHEIGHNFGLKHTFSDSENVIRDVDGLGYNANYYGDRVHDTPACKTWTNDQFNVNGVYDGEDIDNNTLLPETDYNRYYKHESPKINNIMYVHEGGDLPINYVFTPGQIKRMRNTISLDFVLSQNFYDVAVPWEELYKPFEIRLVGGNVANITDNNNGTAEVCRSILQMERYQKGFNMNFYDDDNTIFASSNPDELKELTSGIRNYKTTVNQVYPSYFETIQVPCYRGTICETENYIGGVIISTEILGSMNITVKELNEIEVKDPELFNKLMEQYYYILKKYTSSGAIDQKVFYKE